MSKKLPANSGEKEDFLKAQYENNFKIYKALCEEASFMLSEVISDSGIKIHQIETRIKDLSSIRNKIGSGSYKGIDDLNDVVGARVVCLFKSDIEQLTGVIKENFDVLDMDDKTESDSFGYMSVHFVCRMKTSYRGPRYSKISGFVFEIQLRTLCMHAWAAISHYLDYKAEWDIPEHLRKGLNALSGLFYIADAQYEHMYRSRVISRESAESDAISEGGNKEINLDTVSVLLRKLFPERGAVDGDYRSMFVKELIDNGYDDIQIVERDIRKGRDGAIKHENEVYEKGRKAGQTPAGPIFYDLAMARLSLKEAVPEYWMQAMFRQDDFEEESEGD